MIDKLQLMLINILLDQILNIKVSQGSVATRLRCDGIFNDQFITQSLLSLKVKNFENRSTFAEVMTIKYRVVFFYETRCSFTFKLYLTSKF